MTLTPEVGRYSMGGGQSLASAPASHASSSKPVSPLTQDGSTVSTLQPGDRPAHEDKKGLCARLYSSLCSFMAWIKGFFCTPAPPPVSVSTSVPSVVPTPAPPPVSVSTAGPLVVATPTPSLASASTAGPQSVPTAASAFVSVSTTVPPVVATPTLSLVSASTARPQSISTPTPSPATVLTPLGTFREGSIEKLYESALQCGRDCIEADLGKVGEFLLPQTDRPIKVFFQFQVDTEVIGACKQYVFDESYLETFGRTCVESWKKLFEGSGVGDARIDNGRFKIVTLILKQGKGVSDWRFYWREHSWRPATQGDDMQHGSNQGPCTFREAEKLVNGKLMRMSGRDDPPTFYFPNIFVAK